MPNQFRGSRLDALVLEAVFASLFSPFFPSDAADASVPFVSELLSEAAFVVCSQGVMEKLGLEVEVVEGFMVLRSC